MEKLLLERVYIAIVKNGAVLYASTALDNHLELIKLFSMTEFQQMKEFDHHFPLPGTNLALFKAKEILIALYTKKGYQGQLLSFKTKLANYVDELNGASELSLTSPIEIEAKGQILPKLVETISLTVGLSEDESSVLKLCDGNHSIGEIQVKSRLPRKNVVDIIRHFENKGWLKLESKGEVEVLPISIKKFPETAVRLGMISKKTYDINELCDGNNTINQICKKLNISDREIRKILEKMEENKIVKMTIRIPEEESRILKKIKEKEQVKESKAGEYPELNLKPSLLVNISFTMGFDERERRVLQLLDGSHNIQDIYTVCQIPIVEIFKIIIKYEEKGWIRVPIQEFKYVLAIKNKFKSEVQMKELERKYKGIMEEKVSVLERKEVSITDKAVEPPGLIQEQVSTPELNEQRKYLLKRIQDELPLMPSNIQTQMVEKLVNLSKDARVTMLEKLLTSDSSKKFKKKLVKGPSIPPPVPKPSKLVSRGRIKPVEQPIIEEESLVRPSELFKESSSPELEAPESAEPDLIQPPSEPVKQVKQAADELTKIDESINIKQPSETGILTKGIPVEEEKVTEALNFIDSLLGIPEILYLALIDFRGSILYQTTKESELWDISKDTLKLVQNWQSQAPSVFLGDNLKYATIKATPEMLIATNIKGFGHIVSITINESLFILTKISKEGDALLISDDIAIVAKQINQMFQKGL